MKDEERSWLNSSGGGKMGESEMRRDRPEKLAFDFKEMLSKASDMYLSEY